MPVDVRSLLMATRIPGIGPHRLRALVSHFQDSEAVLRASVAELAKVEGVDRKTALTVAAFARGSGISEAAQFADAQLARMERAGAWIVTLWDHSYPTNLKRIYDPPPFLFCRGTVEQIDSSSVAVVGTRSPSPYGVRMAERFASGLAGAGVTVISGLARGVDTVAHGACLRRDGRTLAVIGSGIDVMYPPENRTLAERIAGCGAVVSEYPMGTKPDAGNFPRRNRIISGISLGTVVIETGVDGGAMITASTALEQNREIFAIPAPVDDKRPSGANRLIREGKALLVESVDDVLAELAPLLKSVLPQKEPVQEPLSVELTLFERAVYEAFADASPVHIDTLTSRARMPVADVLVQLLSLECKGAVRQLPGKYFVRM